ncbi:MAG: hypothetical protein KKC68_09075 [Candidatus Thermoplasmatota archaeon]|nr:hypothetical protein [Candidatus Thermoplasmatota archaeon]
MNPFLNPFITIPFIKNSLLDPGRLQRLNPQQLERYRDKAFKKMVHIAYTVPVYHQKYKAAGIHPNDITGIKDITKLPFITRQDLNQHFPDGVIPPTFKKEKGHIICTGGTTTKYCCNSGSEPVCTYTDTASMLRSSLISSRENHFFQLNWRKTRFAHIGNFNPFKYDEIYEENVLAHARKFIPLQNYLSMQASNRTYEILEKLNTFKPDIIISYPTIFQELAYLKRKAQGSDIQPKLLFVGGAMLDEYTRNYVEDAFHCRMYNTYASCESGAEIAFECTQRNWHIHSDFFHLEAVDQNMENVGPGERGQLVITRLWGNGTPIIRYTGMQDWITLSNGKTCLCGLKSPIFGRPVEGRISSNIMLPDGRIFPPSDFLLVSTVLSELKTFKVKRYQIIQQQIDTIDILLVIDEDQKNHGPSFDIIAKKIENIYQQKTGPQVTITVREVDEIKDDPNTGKPAPLIISNIHTENSCNLPNA